MPSPLAHLDQRWHACSEPSGLLPESQACYFAGVREVKDTRGLARVDELIQWVQTARSPVDVYLPAVRAAAIPIRARDRPNPRAAT